jgi:hypothetical protein
MSRGETGVRKTSGKRPISGQLTLAIGIASRCEWGEQSTCQPFTRKGNHLSNPYIHGSYIARFSENCPSKRLVVLLSWLTFQASVSIFRAGCQDHLLGADLSDRDLRPALYSPAFGPHRGAKFCRQAPPAAHLTLFPTFGSHRRAQAQYSNQSPRVGGCGVIESRRCGDLAHLERDRAARFRACHYNPLLRRGRNAGGRRSGRRRPWSGQTSRSLPPGADLAALQKMV